MDKRSQKDRLTIAETLIASVWEEYCNGLIEKGNLQIAVNIQTNTNRIVWKLNKLMNTQFSGEDSTIVNATNLQQPCNNLATDSISIEKLLTFYERRAKELKGVYGDLGGACSGVAKSIKLLTAQPERKQDELRS